MLGTLFVLAAAAAALSAPALALDSESGDASMSANAPRYATGYATAADGSGLRRVTARFTTFTGDALTIGFALDAEAAAASVREFGIATEELDALLRRCAATQGCDQSAYDRQVADYYRAHALRMRTGAGTVPRLFVDVPEVVRRNRARVAPVATALRQLAIERGHDGHWTVEAAIALIQTGLAYRQPSLWDEGRKILGFYPPLRALERGYGDCDTKAALLAAILQNLTDTPIIGVHVPQHYLIGIAQTPRAGQAYLVHEGRTYVLVETAGPGRRRPGDIAETTQAALDRQAGLRIDPFF